jgi:hypothetical protein
MIITINVISIDAIEEIVSHHVILHFSLISHLIHELPLVLMMKKQFCRKLE